MSKDSGCAACFKALGVPSRLKIYEFLTRKGKATVSDIVTMVKLTQPTVSYHLKEMEHLGLLLSEKEGKKVFYFVDPKCHTYNKDCFLNKVNLEGGTDA